MQVIVLVSTPIIFFENSNNSSLPGRLHAVYSSYPDIHRTSTIQPPIHTNSSYTRCELNCDKVQQLIASRNKRPVTDYFTFKHANFPPSSSTLGSYFTLLWRLVRMRLMSFKRRTVVPIIDGLNKLSLPTNATNFAVNCNTLFAYSFDCRYCECSIFSDL